MTAAMWEFHTIEQVAPWNGPGCPPGSLTLYWGDGCGGRYAIGIGPVPIEVRVGDRLGIYDAVASHIGKLTIGEFVVFDHTTPGELGPQVALCGQVNAPVK